MCTSRGFMYTVIQVLIQGVPDYKECSELFFRDFEPLKSYYNEFDTCSFCKITVYTYDFWRYFNK